MKVFKSIFSLLLVGQFLCFSGQTLQAQEAFGSTDQAWKSGAALAASISDEITQKEAALAMPTLPPADRVLFTAYNQVLGLVQSSLQGATPVGELLLVAYKQVIDASVSDPSTKGVVPSQLSDMLTPLVELLSEVPQMTPQTGQ